MTATDQRTEDGHVVPSHGHFENPTVIPAAMNVGVRSLTSTKKGSWCLMTDATQSRPDSRAKVEHLRRQEALHQGRRKLAFMGVGVLVVAGLGVGVTAAIRAGGTDANLTGVQSFSEKHAHVKGKVAYPQTPPAGGDHSSLLLNCGIYTSPVPNENAVHDLEHGAVWITYRPDLPKADVTRLTAFATDKSYLDLSPFPGLPAPVVVSAWGKQLRLSGAADPRLEAFVKKYTQGPQAPEPGAPCSGGVGTPSG